MNTVNELQPIVSSVEVELIETDIEKKLKALLGNWQAVVAFLLIIPELVIAFGVIELASGVALIDVLKLIFAMQLAFLASHQLDNAQAIIGLIRMFAQIEFKDNRINQLFDMLAALTERMSTEEAVSEKSDVNITVNPQPAEPLIAHGVSDTPGRAG
jgi:hypothetical protein